MIAINMLWEAWGGNGGYGGYGGYRSNRGLGIFGKTGAKIQGALDLMNQAQSTAQNIQKQFSGNRGNTSRSYPSRSTPYSRRYPTHQSTGGWGQPGGYGRSTPNNIPRRPAPRPIHKPMISKPLPRPVPKPTTNKPIFT